MNKLESADWWADTLSGVNAVSMSVDESMPRLMANLDRACKGEQIGIQAILETLSRVQLAAKLYISANEPERVAEPAEDDPAPIEGMPLREVWNERMGSVR